MKKKREIWPYAIVAVFVVFVTFIVASGVTMLNSQVDLVKEDYYGAELKFQEHINTGILTKSLQKEIEVRSVGDAGEYLLTFPLDTLQRKKVSGDILIFRPSDASLDQHFVVLPDGFGNQSIDLRGALPGMWRIKIDWQEGGLSFYHEEPLFLASKN